MNKKALFGASIALSFLTLSLIPAFSMPSKENAVSAWSGTQESTEGDYYNSITSGMSGDTLLSALASIVPLKDLDRAYTNERDAACDEAEDSTSDIISIYTRHNIPKSGASGSYSWNTWNKEHIWPQGSYASSKTDIHNYFACEGKINNIRSSYPFGEVPHNSSTQQSVHGHLTDCYLSGGVFEPCDDAKGEVARSLMYGTMMYGHNLTNMISVENALKWNIEHPVTNRDIFRNNTAYTIQHNRNPFVDHPEYACRIWGNKNETTKQICENSPSPVAPTSITLNKSAMSLIIDESDTLSVASVEPSDASKSVTYTSSNSDVASVSSAGLVKAKAVGSALITVKSALDPNISTTCSVSVRLPDEVELENINLSVDSGAIKVNRTTQINVSNLPINAYPHPTYTYESLTPSLASVSVGGQITGLDVGTATIEVKAYQNELLKATKTIDVEILADYGDSSTYEEVTASMDDFSGKYLIAYKESATSATVLDGSATTDSSRFSATISDGKIEHSDNKYFEVEKVSGGYTIRGTNDQYIYHSGSSNSLNTSDEPQVNTISFNSEASIGCNGRVLKYNTSSHQFRYYTGGQGSITLFKAGSATPTDPKVFLNKTSVSLFEGDEDELVATTIGGNGVVTFESSDPSVVNLTDVENKSVTLEALKEGTATITANYDGGTSATCEVTVGKVEKVLTSIVAYYTGGNINKGSTLNYDKLEVHANYNVGPSERVNNNDVAFTIGEEVVNFSTYKFNTLGNVTIGASYLDKQTTFVVNVIEKDPDPATPTDPTDPSDPEEKKDDNNEFPTYAIVLIAIGGTAVIGTGGFFLIRFLVGLKRG